MTVQTGEMHVVTVDVPAEVFMCQRDCVALRLIDVLREGRALGAEEIDDLGTCMYRPDLDGVIVYCSGRDCEAMGTIRLDSDGKISGIDPLLGMVAFEGCRVEGAGSDLITMLRELEASPPDTGP